MDGAMSVNKQNQERARDAGGHHRILFTTAGSLRHASRHKLTVSPGSPAQMGRLVMPLLLGALALAVHGSAIPIWEMLTHEEKMGRLLYSLVHLVGEYCKKSTIPGKLYSPQLKNNQSSNPVADCRRVLMLYGVTNLMNLSEKSLDFLDPYQRNSQQKLWQAAFKTTFKYPIHVDSEFGFGTTEFDEDGQDGNPKIVVAKRPSSLR